MRPRVVGEARLWYTNGIQTETAYLVALLDAERLRDDHAIREIPHDARPEVYRGLLQGEAVPPQRQCRKVAQPGLVDDMGDGSEDAADDGMGGDGDGADIHHGGDAGPGPELIEDADSDFEMPSPGGTEGSCDIEAELEALLDEQ
eukprot:8106669-Heterocapsa_arctica.AAC.1